MSISHEESQLAARALRLVLARLTDDDSAFDATLAEFDDDHPDHFRYAISVLAKVAGGWVATAPNTASITAHIEQIIAELLDASAGEPNQ